jgi:hypothetical protein
VRVAGAHPRERLPAAEAGGRLVYATCSPLRREDEAIAEGVFSAAHPEFQLLDAGELLASGAGRPSGRTCPGRVFRSWPHRNRMDGFFAAAWQKALTSRRSRPVSAASRRLIPVELELSPAVEFECAGITSG